MAWAGRGTWQAGPGCQRESGARGRGKEPLTGGARLSSAARARAAGPLGSWEERGKAGAGAVWAGYDPAEGGGFFLFLFLFLFSISHFHFLFFVSFYFLFFWINNLLKKFKCKEKKYNLCGVL
jgi:hypothetical protein